MYHCILRFNEMDSDGDIFRMGEFEFDNQVIVTLNGDHTKPIGKVKVIERFDGLFADFTSLEKAHGLYPSIGFQKISKRKYKLHQIIVSENKNIDEKIKRINNG